MNRVRRLYRVQERTAVGEQRGASEEPRRASEPEADDVSEWVTQRRRSWARLLRRIYEADPLVCPRCGEEMQVVSVNTDPVVVDRILAHRKKKRLAITCPRLALPVPGLRFPIQETRHGTEEVHGRADHPEAA